MATGRALGLGMGKGFSAEGLGSSRRVFRWVLAGMAQDGGEMAAAVSSFPCAGDHWTGHI